MKRSPNRGIAMVGTVLVLATVGVYACQSGGNSGVQAQAARYKDASEQQEER